MILALLLLLCAPARAIDQFAGMPQPLTTVSGPTFSSTTITGTLTVQSTGTSSFAGIVQHNGGLYFSAPNSINTNYTPVSTDTVILASATPAGIQINLPTASTVKGQILQVTKIDTSTQVVTIQAASGDLISSTQTMRLNAFMQTDMIMSDGATNWLPVGQGIQITPAWVGPGNSGATANSVGASSQAICASFQTYVPINISSVAFQVNVTGGQTDVGIYDVNGIRLVSNGGTATPAIGIASLSLPTRNYAPGSYWACLSASSVTSTYAGVTVATTMAPGQIACAATAHPLPATLPFPCQKTLRLVNFNIWVIPYGGQY